MKSNCWEYKKCGREPGGKNASELGVCPASSEGRVNGVHGGTNGGRCCWAVSGTLCGGMVQGTFSKKLVTCMSCEFYKDVFRDEKSSPNYKNPSEVLRILGIKG